MLKGNAYSLTSKMDRSSRFPDAHVWFSNFPGNPKHDFPEVSSTHISVFDFQRVLRHFAALFVPGTFRTFCWKCFARFFKKMEIHYHDEKLSSLQNNFLSSVKACKWQSFQKYHDEFFCPKRFMFPVNVSRSRMKKNQTFFTSICNQSRMCGKEDGDGIKHWKRNYVLYCRLVIFALFTVIQFWRHCTHLPLTWCRMIVETWLSNRMNNFQKIEETGRRIEEDGQFFAIFGLIFLRSQPYNLPIHAHTGAPLGVKWRFLIL